MNIFIGGPFEGQPFQLENYMSDEFKIHDLNTDTSMIYLRNEFEKNGLKYTFWVSESVEKEHSLLKMSDILKDK